MGNTLSSRNPEQKYSHFHQQEDQHFGMCAIYKSQDQPDTFVTCVSLVLSHQNVSTIERNLKLLMSEEICGEMNSPFLRVFDYSIKGNDKTIGTKIVSTCQMPSVTFWVEFLRHNLKEFLEWRKAQKRPLNINEIIMTLSKTINAYQLTKNNQVFGPSLKLQDISVSIDGQIKFHPLLGKQFFKKDSRCHEKVYKGCQSSPLRERIMNKRVFRQEKENINSKYLTSKQYRFLSPYLPKDNEFLGKLKKLANQLVLESRYQFNEVRNPQDSQCDEGKQMKRFLSQLHRMKGLAEMKRFLGQPKMNRFYVDFAKLRHEQSQAKFSKILSQIQQRSQKTDTSYHEAVNYVSPFKTQSSNSLQFITPEHYHYF